VTHSVNKIIILILIKLNNKKREILILIKLNNKKRETAKIILQIFCKTAKYAAAIVLVLYF
jgi:hypothetical protein